VGTLLVTTTETAQQCIDRGVSVGIVSGGEDGNWWNWDQQPAAGLQKQPNTQLHTWRGTSTHGL